MSLSERDKILSGSFSLAGKLSLNQYNITAQENRIKRKEKKLSRKYFIIPNYGLPIYDSEKTIAHTMNTFKYKKFLEEDLSKNNSLNSSAQEKEDNFENNEKKVFKGDNYKHYNLHLERIRIDKKLGIKKKKEDYSYTPGVYNCNYDYLYKTHSGLDWKSLTGRKIKKSNDIDDLTISKKVILRPNDNNIGFIDMFKQTQRNGFSLHNDLRQRCEKKFKPINKKLLKEKWKKFLKKPLISKSPFSRDPIFGYRKFSSPKNDKKKKKILKKNNNISPLTISSEYNTSEKKNKNTSSKRNSTFDFNKYLSREYFFKFDYKQRNNNIGFLEPNYKSIDAKSKIMVEYDKKGTDRKNKIIKIKGIDLDNYFDPIKSYEKIHGRKLSSAVKFEKMIARPKHDKLPSFMKGIYNGMSSCISTEKSLILNNYSGKKMYEDKNQISHIKLIEENNEKNSYWWRTGFLG